MDWRGHLSDFEVVGIAKDVRFANLSRLDPSHFYLPAENGAIAGGFPAPMRILLRIPSDSTPVVETRSAVAAVEKDLASSVSLVSLADLGMSRDRLISEWLALFSGVLSFLAVALAGTGIYGVMAYLVTQRTREIGVRLSLGASRSDVLRCVILQGLFPVFAGMGAGLLLAAGFSTIVHLTLSFPGSVDFLYGVPFYDPVSFLGFSCVVLGLAALASVVPASRALRVDPVVALRHE
jgi:ABC-type antimicrobial peptide transport system permease subunit